MNYSFYQNSFPRFFQSFLEFNNKSQQNIESIILAELEIRPEELKFRTHFRRGINYDLQKLPLDAELSSVVSIFIRVWQIFRY